MFGMMEMFSMTMSTEKWIFSKWIGQIIAPKFTAKHTGVMMKDSLYQDIVDTPLEVKISPAHKLEKTWQAIDNYDTLRSEYRIFD